MSFTITRALGLGAASGLLLLALTPGAQAQSISLQCPEDTNHDGVVDTDLPGVVCVHLTGGDGFVRMGDGSTKYIFSFGKLPLTLTDPNQIMDQGMLFANAPAPTITLRQGDELYLTLTNVGMVIRPDLSDPHSIHWHGFPEAAAVFDGVPESSVAINMGSSITYYYKANDPGTYMYHCHVEATEHMQMGMLGNLYVEPVQNGTSLGGFNKFAYNDGDGSTGYDVAYPLLLTSFDGDFHYASFSVQPLPFADMRDDYFMFNGRGYPDTVVPGPLPNPTVDPDGGVLDLGSNPSPRQPVSSLITAAAGQRVLLRIANLSVTEFSTITTHGVPMRVVGRDARLLRADDGTNQSYLTNSVTLGGGESTDVILDTASVTPGTYYLYTSNLHRLANGSENFGGQMTEIRIQ